MICVYPIFIIRYLYINAIEVREHDLFHFVLYKFKSIATSWTWNNDDLLNEVSEQEA